MPYESPARAGFRAVFRHPEILLAEVAWRWTFGIAWLALLSFTALGFLDTLPVTNADRMLLNSGAPLLIADALSHILQGSAVRLLRASAVLVPGIAVLWTLAAAIGRVATLKPLMPKGDTHLKPQLGISFLRATLALAGFAAYFGTAMLAGAIAGAGENMRIDLFFAIFIPLILLVVICWSVLNWFLSVAPLLAVRDGRDALASIAESVHLFRRNSRDFATVGTVFGIIRLVAIVFATLFSLAVIARAGRISDAAIIAALVAITLAYFVVADFLYISRLAAYAEILEEDRGSGVTVRPIVPIAPTDALLADAGETANAIGPADEPATPV
jgi:hypothetical protein